MEALFDIPEEESWAPMEFAEVLDGPVRYSTAPSPAGELLITGDGRSVRSLHMGPDHKYGWQVQDDWVRDDTSLKGAVDQLDAFFAGELTTFELSLAPSGTAFQMQVWRELTTIPYGKTNSYGQIASRLGHPNASRAVGMANGRNPISIIVPCHRVIGANGSLTGYGGGLPRKEMLLGLERRGAR
jgi:methylated-DNA-[protein]-cysteine S-methyltransferase